MTLHTPSLTVHTLSEFYFGIILTIHLSNSVELWSLSLKADKDSACVTEWVGSASPVMHWEFFGKMSYYLCGVENGPVINCL